MFRLLVLLLNDGGRFARILLYFAMCRVELKVGRLPQFLQDRFSCVDVSERFFVGTSRTCTPGECVLLRKVMEHLFSTVEQKRNRRKNKNVKDDYE